MIFAVSLVLLTYCVLLEEVGLLVVQTNGSGLYGAFLYFDTVLPAQYLFVFHCFTVV